MISPVSVDMVERQEFKCAFSTAGTHSAVGVKHGLFQGASFLFSAFRDFLPMLTAIATTTLSVSLSVLRFPLPRCFLTFFQMFHAIPSLVRQVIVVVGLLTSSRPGNSQRPMCFVPFPTAGLRLFVFSHSDIVPQSMDKLRRFLEA